MNPQLGRFVPNQAPGGMCALASLQLTVYADPVTAMVKMRCDRKPANSHEFDLLTHMKTFGFEWSGYGESAKWRAPQHAVQAFEDIVFRRRIKMVVAGLSFFDHFGQNVDMLTYIDAVKNFDPNQFDDDLSSLPPSNVKPESTPMSTPVAATPPSSKRARK